MNPPSGIPKISDYGLIGNCRTAALVSNRGSIDWCCLPHFDSPSYFGAILDPLQGGHYSISPSVPYTSRQSYVEDSNVLQTEFSTRSGRFRVRDCFAVASEEEKSKRLWPPCEILRVIEGLDGEVPLEVRFAPKPKYGRQAYAMYHRGRLGVACLHAQHLLMLNEDFPDRDIDIHSDGYGDEARIQAVIRAGERRTLSLIYTQEAPAILPALGEAAAERLRISIDYWRTWIDRCKYDGRYQKDVRRSALALKLMTFAPSGAVIAAPTTSLPEWIGGTRNWDYRFCWLRDASFTVRGLMRLGYFEEARAYVNWMLDTGASHKAQFQILYGIYGEPAPVERQLEGFSGYWDSRPVRIGNSARDQFQLDIYGEVIDGIFTYARHHQAFDGETRRFLLSMGRKVCELWDHPDEGIWEQRSGRVHHTHSKVMAWVALDRLIRFNRHFHMNGPVEAFINIRQQIHEAIENYGFHPQVGSYTRSFGSTAMDASLLVMPLVDYCKAYSPRMLGTIERIRQKLAREDLVYRYCDTNDGLPGSEGCFGVCSFWLIDALSRSGRPTEARKLFEKFIARANSVGLWSEEIDPATGEFLGNYPQGFTHIGLINSAITLQQEERSAQAA